MTSNVKNEHAAARASKKQVDAEFYDCELTRLHDLMSEVLQRTEHGMRREAACMVAVGAGVFERDAISMPSRAKRAIRLMKDAIFMLDPNASAW
ncbi:hypothetical protein Bsp3421_005007 [Burkholderia sp. FERM BP-3421]|uniref:hypothetical protein n=1 Tax=Burkholderia sp. FERM BP-3421 TaxID=1494466 RepID=UPI00236042AF|nr:hypothetical protein [Burkholderia sp. FERM BP-3421]WDD94861.1 hypothetical protein Bsp3421_005007 [Burkholderia sp. FERM BP-3421]